MSRVIYYTASDLSFSILVVLRLLYSTSDFNRGVFLGGGGGARRGLPGGVPGRSEVYTVGVGFRLMGSGFLAQ